VKKLLIPLVILLVCSFIITACGGGTTTTAPSKTTAAPPPPATTAAVTASPKPSGTTALPPPTASAPPPIATSMAPAPATTTAPAKKIVPTGTITAATASFGQESTDPVFYESLWGWSWWDPLLRWDEKGNFIPWVAESWKLEGNTWTFKIRKDIKFSNGDPLTAEDVKFSVDRFSDMSLSKNPWSFYISKAYNQVETKVLDPYTFQFISARPEPAQAIVFAWTRILPKKYFEAIGQTAFRQKPIGSGPWKFVELNSQKNMKMEANTNYWKPEMIPQFQYYNELQVPEQATRLAMLEKGEVDIALGIDYDRLADMKKKGFATVSLGPPSTSSFCLQGTWLPEAGAAGDIRVRQALSYALNRQEICDTWYAGLAVPGAQFYMYPGCFGWDDALNPDGYDPAKAQALLKEANYPAAFKNPTINIYTTAPGQDYHLLLMGYWKKVGIDVKLNIVDPGIFNKYFFNFSRLKSGDPNVGWMFTWTYQSFFNSMYHSANMYTSTGVHNVGADPQADALYQKAASEVDNQKAYQYFADFQKFVKTKYWNVGIARADNLTLYNPKTLGKWTGLTWVSYEDCLNGITKP
jgi:peptide/nickel transport system substrate-binding protein